MKEQQCTRYWAVFRLTRWKAPTPPACHLARSGRNPDVRPLAGRLPKSEHCHRPGDAPHPHRVEPLAGAWCPHQAPATGLFGALATRSVTSGGRGG